MSLAELCAARSAPTRRWRCSRRSPRPPTRAGSPLAAAVRRRRWGRRPPWLLDSVKVDDDARKEFVDLSLELLPGRGSGGRLASAAHRSPVLSRPDDTASGARAPDPSLVTVTDAR
jgi:hypothetical protein